MPGTRIELVLPPLVAPQEMGTGAVAHGRTNHAGHAWGTHRYVSECMFGLERWDSLMRKTQLYFIVLIASWGGPCGRPLHTCGDNAF